MNIRLGLENEIDEIMELIKGAIYKMDDENIYQWDAIYPSREVFEEDLSCKSLYVFYEEYKIKGIIVLNDDQDEVYNSIPWEDKNGKNLIIHRLCIAADSQGKGIAGRLVDFAESYGERYNYTSIRLDAFVNNKGACTLYEKKGYKKVGKVTFRKGDFYCFEKTLI